MRIRHADSGDLVCVSGVTACRERQRRMESDARSMADLWPVEDNDRHLQSATRDHCSP